MRTKLRINSETLILRRSFGASDQQIQQWEQFAEERFPSLSAFIREACEHYIKHDNK